MSSTRVPRDTFAISTPTNRSIEMRREFAAPRTLLWDAWTRPELLRRWYGGPTGWRLEECEIDLQVGGAWRYVIVHESGRSMTTRGVYRVIDAGHALVTSETNDDCALGAGASETVTTTEFSDLAAGRCQVVSTILLSTTAQRDALLASGMQEGVVSSYARIDRLVLAAKAPGAAGAVGR